MSGGSIPNTSDDRVRAERRATSPAADFSVKTGDVDLSDSNTPKAPEIRSDLLREKCYGPTCPSEYVPIQEKRDLNDKIQKDPLTPHWVPGSWELFLRDTGSSLLSLEKLEYRLGQMEAVCVALSNPSKNVLFDGTGGVGKTLLGIAILNQTLSAGEKALVTVPTQILGDQWSRRALGYLNLRPDQVVDLTGKTAIQRLKAYKDPNILLYVVTPHSLSNDFEKKRVTPRTFKAVVCDEIQDHRGKYPLVPVLKEFREAGVRYYPISATPRITDKEKKGFVEEVDCSYFRVVGPRHNIEIEDIRVNLMGRQGHQGHQRDIISNPDSHKAWLQKDKDKQWSLIPSLAPREMILAALQIKARSLYRYLNDNNLRSERDLLQKSYITSGNPSSFRFATRDDARAFTDAIFKLADRNAFNTALTFEHVRDSFSRLETQGTLAFLDCIARNIGFTRFDIRVAEGKTEANGKAPYRQALYDPRDSEARRERRPINLERSFLLQAADKLASGQPHLVDRGSVNEGSPIRYRHVLTAPTIIELIKNAYTDKPERRDELLGKLKDSSKGKEVFKAYLDDCRDDLADRGWSWFNHPKEEFLFQETLRTISILGKDARILVYTHSAEHAHYLNRAFNARFEKIFKEYNGKSVVITGTGSMKPKTRDENVLAFSRGEAQIAVITDVAKAGIDTTANLIIMANPPKESQDVPQLLYRIRNHGPEIKVHQGDFGNDLSLARAIIFATAYTPEATWMRKGIEAYRCVEKSRLHYVPFRDVPFSGQGLLFK